VQIAEGLRSAFKRHLFATGRLLERAAWLAVFEERPGSLLLRALAAYQNADGGFGHGLEPDLLTPSSSAIAAETALCLMDMTGFTDEGMLRGIVSWVENNLNAEGTLPHPPADLRDYPFQSWWQGPDETRVLAVAGLLHKRGVRLSDEAGERIKTLALRAPRPEKLEMYSYPLFVYALYTPEFHPRAEIIEHFLARLPGLRENKELPAPLFSRYWYHALPLIGPEAARREAAQFIAALQEDGCLPDPFPELPWWRAILTLDGLILLERRGDFV
jgi:hypothetical protein